MGFQLHCSDLDDLRAKSRAIVLGRVQGVLVTYLEPVQTYGGLSAGAINLTIFELKVLKYARGSGPDTIYVADEGDLIFHDWFEFEPSMLNVGETYLLFLSNNWSCAPSPPYSPCVLPPTELARTFLVIGGPMGKLLISDGRVYGFGFTDCPAVLADGMLLNDAIAQVSGRSIDLAIIIAATAASLVAVDVLTQKKQHSEQPIKHPPGVLAVGLRNVLE